MNWEIPVLGPNVDNSMRKYRKLSKVELRKLYSLPNLEASTQSAVKTKSPAIMITRTSYSLTFITIIHLILHTVMFKNA